MLSSLKIKIYNYSDLPHESFLNYLLHKSSAGIFSQLHNHLDVQIYIF